MAECCGLPDTNSISPLFVAIATGGFTLVAVWLGGVFGMRQAKTTLLEQARLQERREKFDRIEELYELVSRWLKTTISDHLVFRPVMKGEISYNQALDLVTKIDRAKFDSSRMVALAELYVPEKSTEFQGIHEADEAVNKIQWAFKEEYKNLGPDSRDCSAELSSALRILNDRTEAYKAELVKIVQDV